MTVMIEVLHNHYSSIIEIRAHI